MKVTCKITGEAKRLQKKIAKTYELDKLLTKLSKKNGVTKY